MNSTYLEETTLSKRSSGSSWTDESTSSYDNYSKTLNRTFFWRLALNQRLYYVAGLVLNALLLSFYAVMAFTPHAHCETPTGFNVTKGFEFSFKLGFYATAADFINSSFFEFYVRQRNHTDMQKYGHVSAKTQTLETVYAVMEWVFRGLFVLVTILQLLVRCSATGRYCVH